MSTMTASMRQASARRASPSTSAHNGAPRAVLRRLLGLIKDKQLAVGERLPNIRELAARLEVKPTLVRDALLQAQTMGVVRILPRSGAFIQQLTYEPLVEILASTLEPAFLQADHNLLHLLDARRLLEIELAGRAAERRRIEDLLPVRRALEDMARLPETERRMDYVEA